MIDIIGAPFDLCGKRLGSRLGPAALRLAGISSALSALGMAVEDLGDVAIPSDPTAVSILEVIGRLRSAVLASLRLGHTPLVLGGEHTLAAAGVSAALEHYGTTLGLLWIDAHADVNTPGTSDTGNLHGMPIAALAGLESGVSGTADARWQDLLRLMGDGPRLNLRQTAWYGLRDVDRAEVGRLTGLAVTMHEIDRYGVEATLRRCNQWFEERGVKHLWVSFDVDVLDPILAPGTGTAVRGGLSYREAHLLAELLYEVMSEPNCPYRLAGVDLVETNPLYDSMNATAIMAVEWVASLFGKKILGQPK